MPLVARFDMPGSLRDAPAGSAFYDHWHRRIAALLEDRRPGSGSGEFVDPSRVALRPVCEPTYAWTGFPRPHLVVNHRDDREAAFKAGEDRLAQHEYLEWHVTRDARSRITKATFTTETPEYWEALIAAWRAAFSSFGASRRASCVRPRRSPAGCSREASCRASTAWWISTTPSACAI